MSAPATRLLLEPAQLSDIRHELSAGIRLGLERDEMEIRALPAHVPPPPHDLEGDALVVDTGGTNMRAAAVRLRAGAPPEILAGPVQERLPVRDEAEGDLDDVGFFAMQAELAQRIDAPKGLPVGYCFSYPSEVYADRDARLIAWTKGIKIPGVVGALVGSRLRSALADAGLRPGPVAVLNDTVASLLAGARTFEGNSRHVLGLIAGTGTNMAGFHDAEQVPKLAGAAGTMAINYESGNFTPPHLIDADEVVDANSVNPGRQRFEKAVSGFYLPFVFAALHPELTDFDPHDGTGPIAGLAEHGPPGPTRDTAVALLNRSADLVAAGLAGALDNYPADAKHVGILAEGSLFWRAPGYVGRVKSTLRSLLGNERSFEILEPNEANLVGGACAVLVE